MANPKTQHWMFAFQAMPILFHNETAQFQALLKRDELGFLKFWWERVGLNFAESERTSPEGMSYSLHPYQDGRQIILLRLPTPKIEQEAYYLGLVTRPVKKSILPWRNLARVFVLTLAKDEQGQPQTAIGELTRSARLVPVKGKAPQAVAKNFLDRIVGILDRKQ